MKLMSEKTALKRLSAIREEFRGEIVSNYETNAKNCMTCEVQGECCTDAHFVNVHISRLEAVAIKEVVADLDPSLRAKVVERNKDAAKSLCSTEDSFSRTYSCPLFEKGTGCLVHKSAKPLPCINHACYEREADLPPSSILEKYEEKIGRLNDRVYRNSWNWLPIPVWLGRFL